MPMTVALPQLVDVRPGDQRAIEQIEEWFRTWHAAGDPTVRERIILAHLGLAERLASRYRDSGGVGHEDLVQAARVGLVTAVNRYDPDRGNSFIVYAIVCITGELRRCLRDTSWRVHVARTLKERALQVVRARDELTADLERSPTLEEIAARLSITEEHVAEALEAIDTRCQWSLDAGRRRRHDQSGGAAARPDR
jgi:RNA polymerase sigma-B factor